MGPRWVAGTRQKGSGMWIGTRSLAPLHTPSPHRPGSPLVAPAPSVPPCKSPPRYGSFPPRCPPPGNLFVFGVVVLAAAALLARGRTGRTRHRPRARSRGGGLRSTRGPLSGLGRRCRRARPRRRWQRTLTAAAALVLWGALCVLAFHRVRRRELFWIAPFGLFTVLALSDATPTVAFALVLTIPMVARWRWQDSTGRRALSFALLAAFLLRVVVFAPVPGGRAAGSAPGFRLVQPRRLAGRQLAGLYFLLALPGLLQRWSVGVRRVSRRLALLLLLSGVVPVLLMAIMWGFSTQLGVRAERALLATTAGRTGGRGPARLTGRRPPGAARAAGPAARRGPGPPGLARAEALARRPAACGAKPIGDEAALRQWPDSLPQGCMIRLGAAQLARCARRRARGRHPDGARPAAGGARHRHPTVRGRPDPIATRSPPRRRTRLARSLRERPGSEDGAARSSPPGTPSSLRGSG